MDQYEIAVTSESKAQKRSLLRWAHKQAKARDEMQPCRAHRGRKSRDRVTEEEPQLSVCLSVSLRPTAPVPI